MTLVLSGVTYNKSLREKPFGVEFTKGFYSETFAFDLDMYSINNLHFVGGVN